MVPPSSSSPAFVRWIVLAVILAATVITYWPVFDATKEFTNWDDPAYVTEQPLVRSLDRANISEMFKTESRVAANYHPLTMLTLAVDYQRGEGSMLPFMQTTIALHVINTALVFVLVLMLMRGNLVVAALSSALFGLHPMHVESVAWVAERKDVLYTVFYLASLIGYLRYVRGGSIVWLLAAFVSFVASCYAKPMAVTLPVLLMVIDLFERRGVSARSILEKVPFLIVSVIFGLLTLEVQSSTGAGLVDVTYYTVGERVLFALYGIVEYCIKLVVPMQLSAFYPYPSTNGDPETVVYIYSLIAMVMISAISWAYWKRRSELTTTMFVGMAFFLVTISIVLQLISVGGAVIADRYTYVPYIGLFLIIGTLLDRYLPSTRAPYMALGIIAIVSTAMAVATSQRIGVWNNSGALWEDVIQQYGNRPIYHAYNNRAVYHLNKGAFAKAEQDYRYLESVGTTKSYTYKGYGALLQKTGRFAEAIPRFTKALQYGGDDVQVLRARGMCYSRIEKHDSAIVDFKRAQQIRPNDIAINMMLLEEYVSADRLRDALEHGRAMEAAARAIPQYHLLMGIVQGNLGDHAAAYAAFQRTLELDPNNALAKRNIEIARR